MQSASETEKQVQERLRRRLQTQQSVVSRFFGSEGIKIKKNANFREKNHPVLESIGFMEWRQHVWNWRWFEIEKLKKFKREHAKIHLDLKNHLALSTSDADKRTMAISK